MTLAGAAADRLLQDTVAQTLLPRVLDALQEPVGTVLDNLNRAERLRFVASVAAWSEVRASRNRMIHESLRSPGDLALALQAAHAGVPALLVGAASPLVVQARQLPGKTAP